MAVELVGGAFLSASLQVLFERLASSEGLNLIRGQNLSDSLLRKLKIKLLIVDAVLNHAEVKQFTDPAVKKWLLHVKDTLYDAEDLLDEIATEALRCKMEPADRSQTASAQAWESISTWMKAPFGNYQSSIESRVKEMIAKLEDLAEAIDKLGLKPGDGEKLPPRSPSISLVDESCVFGRDEIKEEMIKRLLSDNVSTNKIDVISIVGMGGAGKTTLAQLLYNDGRVKQHFELKAWVCVSEEFFLLNVTKSILEGIGCDMKSDNLDLLQLELKDSLCDKKFLLVLDDVWDRGCSEWDRLRIPLLAAEKGSKVVVTTRNKNVAAVMRAVHPHLLGELSAEDCWSLFTKLAFENGDSAAFPELESIGRKIVAKCQGLPLAVKALGSLLYSKVDKREWEEILESEIWDLQNHEILPSLILSYHDLPLHLKRCFAYCSIFPKDHEFDKKKLILQWMAEGFLQFSQSNRRMEEVGDLYFHELLSKSFFQKSVNKESCFLMHDLIHDLAQYISGEFCVRLEDDKVQKITEKAHHLLHFKSNFDRMVVFKRFEALTKVKCLRTFMELKLVQKDSYYELSKRVSHDILPKMRYLRVLSLNGYKITDLPDSIGKLIYLRYLDLSYTMIKKLPDSVCCLYNLQTMILSGCGDLNELPSRIDKLINLRYLDITYPNYGLKEMPSHIGQLKSLQQLTDFIVGEKNGLRIGELGELSDIRGKLVISKMENVVCAKDALQANMKDKRHLDELTLNWTHRISAGVIQSGVIDQILNNLQPHSNLKQFKIINYPGVIFPNWVGDPLFSNLLFLRLWGCNNCSSLPPLGLLPSLQHLHISGIKGIERVGSEFYGDVSSSITIKPSFPSLQTLRFEFMDKWEKWLCCGCRRGEFPRLQELYIKKCPKLTGKLPKQLRCLKKLVIDECPHLLVASLKVPAIRELRMWKSGKLRLKRPASGLTALQTIEISDVSQWKQLPFGPHMLTITVSDAVESLLEEGILQNNMCDLRFFGCCFSRSLEKGTLSTTLKSLDISCCNRVEFLLPELLRCHHPVLQKLRISLCTCESLSLSFSLAIFPSLTDLRIKQLEGLEFLSISISEGDPASLNYLEIRGCPNLVYIELPALDSACYKIFKCLKLKLLAHTLSYLRRLDLSDCPELLLQKGGLPSNLHELTILNCNKLTPEVDWGLQRLASLTHLQILGGCEEVESFPKDCLLPSSLTSLEIMRFPKLKSLDSKGLQQLTSLTTLSILFCPELQFFAEEVLQPLTSLTKLFIGHSLKLQFIPGEWFQHFPSLMELTISYCHKLRSLTGSVFRHLTSLQQLHIGWCPELQFLSGLQYLTSLIELTIWGCPGLQFFTEMGLQSLASLKILHVSNFPQLQSLTQASLQHLTSLERLSIFDCSKLQYLTEERLSDSLSYLSVEKCPLLEQQCQYGKGQEWRYIAHIPHIVINGVLM